mgnify:CR=1 FL=1
MNRQRTYTPSLPMELIKALYYEAKARRMPMTRLLAEIVSAALKGSPSMRIAKEELQANIDQRVA